MSNLHRKCAKCGRTRAEDTTVTYHRFPNPGLANFTKARAWAVYCWPDKDWSSTESLYSLYVTNKVLCGRHFDFSQFYDSGRQKLSKFAVPISTEVEELLANRENVFNENDVKQPRLQDSRVPFSRRENVDSQVKIDTVIQIPGTSKSNSDEHNYAKQPSEMKLQESQVPFSQKQNEDNQVKINALIQMPGTSKLNSDEHITSIKVLMPEYSPSNILPSSMDLTLTKTAHKKRNQILSSINVSKVSDLTLREAQLYNVCRKKIKEIIRLRKSLKKKKGSNVRTICQDESVLNLCNANISSSFALLLQSQLKNCPKKPKGRRYSLDEKIMALVIYKKSPACYRLLRRMFTLPCQSSLNKLLNRVPLRPGINSHIFSSLKKMTEDQSDAENICILSFDEMSLRKHLFYDKKLDEIQGFTDHGNHGRNRQTANKALVFMVAGLRKKWKQPIAYYLSHTINADRMTVILKEILTECFKANLNVVATVCDLSTVNLKVLRTLGATTREPYFTHSEREIVAVLDPPHLLKCTRNLFLKHDVECMSDFCNNETVVKGTAKWSHIQKFYDLDKNNANFVFAPALTENHLNPNLKLQMRVKLAAQVFSHSVTAGILAKIASNELPNEAHVTAMFLQKFDELFDALNADSPDLRGGKKYSTNLTLRSPHLELFSFMKKFITSMKYLGSKSNPPSQDGWIHTINAVERLWKNLQSINIKSLSTRRLNQDPLENCFGCIRYNCGSSSNPNIPQFIAGVKTAIISNLRHSGQKRNCEDDNAVLATNLKNFLTVDPNMSDFMCENKFDIDEDEIYQIFMNATETINQASPESQACAYVCGFIFKKIRREDCSNCRNIFITKNQEPIHIFTSLKEYDSCNSLNYINNEIVKLVELMASLINNFLKAQAWKPDIKLNIFNILDKVDFNAMKSCNDHYDSNILKLKTCTFFICIKRYIILCNREIEEEEKKRALERKMKILKNK